MAMKTASISKADAEYGTGDGPVGGLILHAPFLSVYRVVIDTGCTLPGDKFPNIDLINMVKSPVLLIHGTGDQIVPFHHSETLFEAIAKEYRASPLYIEGMSHNNVHSQVRPLFVEHLLDYLSDYIRTATTPSGNKRQRLWKLSDRGQDSEDERRALGLR